MSRAWSRKHWSAAGVPAGPAQIDSAMPPDLEQFLTASLDLQPHDATRVDGLVDLTGLFQIHGLPGDLLAVPCTGAYHRSGTRPSTLRQPYRRANIALATLAAGPRR